MQYLKDFPVLARRINGKRLVYLDNAATSQKPTAVLKAMDQFYKKHNANVHRGIYQLSVEATEAYEGAHKTVADFIGADWKEIVFTKNATEALNLLAYSLGSKLRKGDEIVLTQMEHHSNIVPWQQAAKRTGAVVKYIPVAKDGTLDLTEAKRAITTKTKIVSVTHVSNVLGTINPVFVIGKMARAAGAAFVVDGAQSVPHMQVDVKKINCDFMVFSGHKMLGPTGIGVLYGKAALLEKMDPFLFGGDMIREVSYEDAEWNELPWKFEAGTPNIAEAVGLAAAIKYLQKIGMDNIFDHESGLAAYAVEKLSKIKGVKIYGPRERAGVVAFTVGGVHPHDLAEILNEDGIAIRAGHHCAMPLHRTLGVPATARASFHIYNDRKDVDALVASVQRAKRVFA